MGPVVPEDVTYIGIWNSLVLWKKYCVIATYEFVNSFNKCFLNTCFMIDSEESAGASSWMLKVFYTLAV